MNDETLFICPDCGKGSTNPSDAEFGWCGMCLDYTGTTEILKNQGYPSVLIHTDGLMGCCAAALRAWLLLHPEPWADGTAVECPHHTISPLVMLYSASQDVWAWTSKTDHAHA